MVSYLRNITVKLMKLWFFSAYSSFNFCETTHLILTVLKNFIWLVYEKYKSPTCKVMVSPILLSEIRQTNILRTSSIH